MTRLVPLLALALLAAGCNRADRQADTLDADAEARNRTAAKTLADIAAAEKAAGTPVVREAAAPVRAAVAEPEAQAEPEVVANIE